MRIKTRESNLDLLRILCCITVVTTHISSRYKAAITDPNILGELLTTNIPTVLLFDTLTRFTVPGFVMLAGAFALANDKNADYRYYYKRTLQTIGVPTVIFSALYFLNTMVTQGRLVLAGQAGLSALLTPVKAWILGVPYYHMWYLYTMIGLYVLTPVIIRWKNSISVKTFRRSAVALLLLCTISGWTSVQKLRWDVGVTFCYTGYYIMGYVLRDVLSGKKSNLRAFALLAAAIAALLVVTWIQYDHSLRGLAESDETYAVIGTFNPLVVLASCLVFSGFCVMKAGGNFDWLVKRTFYIYLFHAGVLTQLSGLIFRWDVAYCWLTIPVGAAVVLAISFALSVGYETLWAALDDRLGVSRRIENLFAETK